METGENDNTDNDDDVYDNGTLSASTMAVKDFSRTCSYGTSWSLSGVAPNWRNKAVYSIWSMAPAGISGLTPASPDTEIQPDWTDRTGFPTDQTDMTDDEIKAAQDAVTAKFRTLKTFNYKVNAYAPMSASTSIYKDLVFAYNEETRSFQTENGKLKVVGGQNVLEDGQTQSFDIKFYHALAAVKFKLTTATTGANVHSVTLCYTDDAGNIVTTDGIATSGDCKVIGSTATTVGGGSQQVTFEWSNQGDKKPVHFEFSDAYSSPANSSTIAGGYANTSGEGVLFMIPQKAKNLMVIVEFSKYGGSEYYTKVITTGLNVNWEAGKSYTYDIQIGEFHVPGELLPISTAPIVFDGLKNSGASGTTGKKAFTPDVKAKGVSCIGFLIADYASSADADMPIYVYMSKNNVDPYPYAASNFGNIPSGNIYTWSDINFKYADNRLTDIATAYIETNKGKQDQNVTGLASAVNAIDFETIYEFGLSYDGSEVYKSLDNSFVNTGASGKPKDFTYGHSAGYSLNGPYYYAYRIPENVDNDSTNDVNTVNFVFKTAASSNNLGATIYVLGVMVLEVKSDTNLPRDFSTFDWESLNS